ncbi:uncharacterized protein LOC129584413 [Paramacrobiotus metropolitanus]|uniref:uncharacterized protein LOC129584413 n=1 Tax=Paramacrobiotus metropolitanus TaxID=2943436 RepID=UPI002445C46E|nr:uncharacterized protein LOC129584413 [Paramacrobiotus metropolitanus]
MGLYPYYPSCVVRNYTTQFFCFDRRNSTMSINTFMTAVWDDEYQWFTWRPGADDTVGMKCCKVPKGYFIDYVSCYYMSTHDEFGEYYDSLIQFMVYCSPGYVATGMSRKIDASKQNYIIDWIQCCRLGHGAPTVVSPPRAEIDGGYPSYIARENYIPYPIPQDYQAQYRSVQNQMRAESPSNNGSPTTVNFQEPLRRSWRWKATDLVDRHPLDKEYALPSM